jgi:prepilin-type N-terminal cleavage/methylation domain-containing protein
MKSQQSILRSGFTLVEMLVVIGMIGILAASLIGSFSHIKSTARGSQAQVQVSEVATAFNLYLQQEREWPAEALASEEMDADVCKAFQFYRYGNFLDLTTWSTNGTSSAVNLNSPDRFGLLDIWGRAALRKYPRTTSADAVLDGVKLSDHRIQFRLDTDMDGYVDSGEGSPKGAKVRASVLVWSRGPDGKDASTQAKRYPGDDRLSWSYGQARSEK